MTQPKCHNKKAGGIKTSFKMRSMSTFSSKISKTINAKDIKLGTGFLEFCAFDYTNIIIIAALIVEEICVLANSS